MCWRMGQIEDIDTFYGVFFGIYGAYLIECTCAHTFWCVKAMPIPAQVHSVTELHTTPRAHITYSITERHTVRIGAHNAQRAHSTQCHRALDG